MYPSCKVIRRRFNVFFFCNEQLHNVALAIDLMRDSGMKFYAKPEGKEIISNNNTTVMYPCIHMYPCIVDEITL